MGCDHNSDERRRGDVAKQSIKRAGDSSMNQVANDRPATTDTAKIIYILYLVGLATGITALVGVVMAYVNKDEAPDWLRTHYLFQIRTFWIGVLYCVIGFILMFVLIGFLVWLFWAIWLIVRVIKGFKHLEQREPIPNYETWMFP
jgi:uncharacterized membrane protein